MSRSQFWQQPISLELVLWQLIWEKKLSMPWLVCLCWSCLWFLNISIKNCWWWGHARLSFRWQCNFHQAAFLHFYESIQLWSRSRPRQTTHSQSKKQEKQKLWPPNFSSASNLMAWRNSLKCVCIIIIISKWISGIFDFHSIVNLQLLYYFILPQSEYKDNKEFKFNHSVLVLAGKGKLLFLAN